MRLELIREIGKIGGSTGVLAKHAEKLHNENVVLKLRLQRLENQNICLCNNCFEEMAAPGQKLCNDCEFQITNEKKNKIKSQRARKL